MTKTLVSQTYQEGALFEALNEHILMAASDLPCIFFTIQTILHEHCGCEKVGNIFAQNYSFIANGSDAPKIEVSFHLLMFAHLGGCLWCEGEGLSHCVLGHMKSKKNLWGFQG